MEFRHVYERFHDSPLESLNESLAVMRELVGFENIDIIERQLDRRTVRELREYHRTNTLPPRVAHITNQSTATATPAASDTTAPTNDSDRINQMERRINELEAQLKIIVQLLK